MTTTLPVWLELPALIVAVVIGHIFVGWVMHQLNPPPPPKL